MDYCDYMVFVDESGDHSLEFIDPDYSVFVLCFCIIAKTVYVNELAPKSKLIKIETFGHDLVVFHESDIRKKRGAFSQLGKDSRDLLLSKLADLIDGLDFTVVAIIIDKVRHKERYTYPDHPYHLAMQYGLERVYSFLRQSNQSERKTHFIFEARGKNEDEDLELAFRRVCAGKNRGRKIFNFDISIANKQTNSEGMQLADLIARPIGLSVVKPDQRNIAYEIIESKFYKANGTIYGNGRKVFP